MTLKTGALYTLGGLLALVATFGAGRYSRPAEIEIRTEYVEKVREVRVVQMVRVLETRTKRVIVSKPDGTTTTTEDVVTKENERTAKNTEIEKETEGAKVSVTKNVNKTNWHLGVHAGLDVSSTGNSASRISPIFGVTVGHRLVGPFSITATGFTSGLFAAGVAIDF